MKIARRRTWCPRLLLALALMAVNYSIPKAEATCYKCVAGCGGSCCDEGGSKGQKGYTDCLPLEGGGCSPNGGSPCTFEPEEQ